MLTKKLDGHYNVIFKGPNGWGTGAIAIRGNEIFGADPNGGTYDGKITKTSDGYHVDLNVVVTDGRNVITGQPGTIKLPLNLPRDFDGKDITGPGGFSVTIRKIRDFII